MRDTHLFSFHIVFLDIKCRKTGLKPSAAVIVATCRALKLHGGADEKTLSTTEDVEAVKKGMSICFTSQYTLLTNMCDVL